jgi:hypothetical protein
VSDHYAFWRSQLAGEHPETTPGEPHAGFFKGGSSGSAYKRAIPETFIAIWQEDGEWIARTDRHGAEPVFHRGWKVDEFVFPRCCRNAIEYSDYLKGIGHEPD